LRLSPSVKEKKREKKRTRGMRQTLFLLIGREKGKEKKDTGASSDLHRTKKKKKKKKGGENRQRSRIPLLFPFPIGKKKEGLASFFPLLE